MRLNDIFFFFGLQTSGDGNVTTSVLTLTPSADDDREHLTCRIKNGLITGAVLEDSIRLDVLCKLAPLFPLFPSQ